MTICTEIDFRHEGQSYLLDEVEVDIHLYSKTDEGTECEFSVVGIKTEDSIPACTIKKLENCNKFFWIVVNAYISEMED